MRRLPGRLPEPRVVDSADMKRPRVHLIAPAGSCWPFLEALELKSAAELIAIVQDAIGCQFEVSGDEELIQAREAEQTGGRVDDAYRAADLQRALAADEVAAIVLIRGGAWFTRILPHIDFSVLDRRRSPVALFGFSELTTAVNIVASYRHGLGIYDMGPAFLTYGLKRYAATRTGADSPASSRPASWMRQRLRCELAAFFGDVVSMIEGRGTRRPITAYLASGRIPDRVQTSFSGGNLTVLSALVGTAFDDVLNPAGRWLVIEDFNEKVERIDRFLAHLTLAGYWTKCEGILLGDFHKGYEDLTQAVLALLRFHLSEASPVPVLVADQVGHIWPMSPLPLHLALTIERRDESGYSIHWPAEALRTVPLPHPS
jgi:muramoyltetrapeptide carboxypeptidase